MRALAGPTVLGLALALASCAGEDRPPTARSPRPASSPDPVLAEAKGPRTERRLVISLSRTSGTDVATIAPDGTRTVAFDVLENGRGPHVDATLALANDGTLVSFSAKGHHTMGTAVEESFAIDGARARWESLEESGERPTDGPAFFVPIAPLPDATGLLAEALIKNGGSLRLLPGGEARITKTGATTVQSKDGQEKRLVSYAIAGLDLVPTHVWMNEDGTWFGNFMPWQSVVPEGWENVVDTLVEKQTQYDRDRDAALATAAGERPPAAGLAYMHARVLDVVRGRYALDQTIVVVGDTIRKVGPSQAVKPPAGATVVDLSGKTVIPGLWDMHTHLSDADGVLHLASGVTTVRDVGNDPDKLDDWKKRYDEGTAVGPKVIRFGFIEGRNEKAASSKVTAETESEAKAAVEHYARRGYEGIKIYNSVKPALVPLLAKEAHARKMRVTGHIPVHMLANEAVVAGYDGIEHINMLFLNFFADHETDTRTTTRFTLVGDKAAAFDLKSKPATDFFALLKAKKTVIDPTLVAFEDLLLAQQGKVTPSIAKHVARLPIQAQRGFLMGGLPAPGKEALYTASFDKLLAMVKALHEHRVPLVVGTDAIAGLSLHHELALYVRAGIAPAEALRLATVEAARSLDLENRSGSIAEGKAADLVVLDGDPLARIEDIGSVVSTMRGGIVYPARKLYESVGILPWK